MLWTSSVYNTAVSAGRFTINLDAASGSPSLVDRIGERTAGQGIYFQVEVDSGAADGNMDSATIVLPRLRAKGTAFALSAAKADAIAGVTATSAELNQLVGVTGNLQSQISLLAGAAPMVAVGITSNVQGTVNYAYFTNSASLVGVTLPSSCSVGDRLRVIGQGAGGWRAYQNAGQTIHFPQGSTTTGTIGYLKSTDAKAAVEVVCRNANTDWQVSSSTGNFTGDYLTGVSSYGTAGTYTLTVPNNVTRLTIKAWGGGGGGGAGYTASGGAGGGAAYATASVSVVPGSTLTIVVAGGGSGGPTNYRGGGGGGASLVKQASILLLAGGGGGGGGAYGTTAGGAGGAAGFSSGLSGANCSDGQSVGGAGGTAFSGGASGAGVAGSGVWVQSGSFLNGAGAGNGGGAGGVPGGGVGGSGTYSGNGGGGSGWFGGGSGGYSAATGTSSGAGGGSSLGDSGSDGSGTTPGNSGDAQICSSGVTGKGGSGGGASSAGTNGGAGCVVVSW